MMNPELKAKWIAALRSGKYQQGKDRLRTHDNKFCCLGVLCDINDNSGWQQQHSKWIYTKNGQSTEFYLDPFLKDFELTDKVQTQLSVMNDKGKNFNQIADAIESWEI